jgi:hypothetical protein
MEQMVTSEVKTRRDLNPAFSLRKFGLPLQTLKTRIRHDEISGLCFNMNSFKVHD